MDLKGRLLQAQLLSTEGSPESRLGFQSSVNFCLRKRDEGWTVEQFIDEKKLFEERYKQFKDTDYYKSCLYARKLNIEDLGG